MNAYDRFLPEDLVRLRTGGRRMLVVSVDPRLGVLCSRLVHGRVVTDRYPAHALELILPRARSTATHVSAAT